MYYMPDEAREQNERDKKRLPSYQQHIAEHLKLFNCETSGEFQVVPHRSLLIQNDISIQESSADFLNTSEALSNQQTLQLLQIIESLLGKLYQAYEPILVGLNYYSLVEVVIKILYSQPGTSKFFNPYYLAYGISIPPLMAFLKALEPKYSSLKNFNINVLKLNTFPSSLVLNMNLQIILTGFSAFELNHNKVVEGDIPGYGYALQTIGLAGISLFVTLSPFGLYNYLEKKYESVPIARYFFWTLERLASFIRNFTKTSAQGDMIITLLIAFALISPISSNPLFWFLSRYATNYGASLLLSAFGVYLAYYPGHIRWLGNQKRRQMFINNARIVLAGTAITGINAGTLVEIWNNPQETNRELIYASGGVSLAMLLWPLFVLLIQYFISLIQRLFCGHTSSRFKPVPKQGKKEFYDAESGHSTSSGSEALLIGDESFHDSFEESGSPSTSMGSSSGHSSDNSFSEDASSSKNASLNSSLSASPDDHEGWVDLGDGSIRRMHTLVSSSPMQNSFNDLETDRLLPQQIRAQQSNLASSVTSWVKHLVWKEETTTASPSTAVDYEEIEEYDEGAIGARQNQGIYSSLTK